MPELHIEEKGPLIRWNWKSKFVPMDMTFKLNEETDVYDAMLKETTKNVATKCGNVLDIVTVSTQGTWITKCTVGHTFMVFVSIIMHQYWSGMVKRGHWGQFFNVKNYLNLYENYLYLEMSETISVFDISKYVLQILKGLIFFRIM